MEAFLKKIAQIKLGLSLPATKRQAIREQLLAVMNAQPLAQQPGGSGPNSRLAGVFVFRFMIASTIIAILIVIGGGMTFAAQYALPGHWLYPIKVSINEEVRSYLTVNSEAKAVYELQRAEARLEEAAQLAMIGQLEGSAKKQMEDNLTRHMLSLQRRLAGLKSQNKVAAAALTSDLETTLSVQQSVLGQLRAKSKNQQAVEILQNEVVSRLSSVNADRASLETEIATTANTQPEVKTAAEGKLKAATEVIRVADVYIVKKADLSAEAESAARARLELATSLIELGNEKLTNGFYGEAFTLANRALRVAQEARLLTRAQTDFGLDLHLERSDTFRVKGASDRNGDSRGSEWAEIEFGSQ